MTVEEYLAQLGQDVAARAETEGTLQEQAFFDVVTEMLVACGQATEANYSQHRHTGVQVDGYAGPPSDEESTMKLFLVDFDAHFDMISVLGQQDLRALAKRGENFLKKALDPSYTTQLEESSDVFGLATILQRKWSEILKIQLIVLSNKRASGRLDLSTITLGNIRQDTPVVMCVWDIQRLTELANQNSESEPLTIDFSKLGYSVPVLRADTGDTSYEAFLAVLPGRALADIYERYGTRILEQNVRVFLQARGKVNQGIQRTILDEPDMFFAYNNGLTATAENVVIEDTPNGAVLREIHNFQIVNGGQTAASVHLMSTHCRKRWRRGQEPDLGGVFVQMKLSVIPPEDIARVVPKISRFSNSQNKISDADFFSTHQFHVAMERFANRLIAPAREGSITTTKWFYERMRGQYQNERSKHLGTRKDLRTFEAKIPRRQVITKAELAKYLLPWDGKPEIAQRGSAKCFMAFAQDIDRRWNSDSSFCNENFFRSSIAKAIVFRGTERIVSKQEWYQGGGARAPIVIHTIGKLAGDLEKHGLAFPFQRVWQRQDLLPVMEATVAGLAEEVKEIILDPPLSGQLPTEWAKQSACTTRCAELRFEYPSEFLDMMVSSDDHASEVRAAKSDQRLTDSVTAEIFVQVQGPEFWREVLEWATSRDLLSEKDRQLLQTTQSPRLVSERQAAYIYKVWENLVREGCPIEPSSARR